MIYRPLDRPPPMRQRTATPCVPAFALAALVGMLAGCSAGQSASAPADASTPRNLTLTAEQRGHIRIDTIAPSPYRTTVETTGVVDFDNDHATSVIAAFSGPVSKLLVSVGDKVNKGDALAIVDSSDFASAIGAYAKALVTAKNARHIADVDKDLLAHNGVGQREEEQAQTDAAGAEADRDAALQALVSLGVDLRTIRDIQAGRVVAHAQGVIRAPVSGTVAEKLITPGQLLQAGATPCFTVADLSHLWVMAQVSDSELSAVAVGDPADVQAGDDAKPLHGTVTNVSPLVDPDTRATTARVLVDNRAGALKKAMYVHVSIRSRNERNGLLVPVSAVLRDDENLPFVYAVQPDGSYARRRVTLGERVAEGYVVQDGVASGDRIVADGALFMQFMQSQ